MGDGERGVTAIAWGVLVGCALVVACGGPAGGGGGGGGGGVAGTCDSPAQCSGTLNGSPFPCTNGFSNSHSVSDGGTETRLGLNLGLTELSFVGPPPSGSSTQVTLLAGDSITGYGHGNLPDGGGFPEPFEALVGPKPLGSITVVISSAKARDGGTPGDYCLDGTLNATLVDTLWVELDAGFDAGRPPQPDMQLILTF